MIRDTSSDPFADLFTSAVKAAGHSPSPALPAAATTAPPPTTLAAKAKADYLSASGLDALFGVPTSAPAAPSGGNPFGPSYDDPFAVPSSVAATAASSLEEDRDELKGTDDLFMFGKAPTRSKQARLSLHGKALLTSMDGGDKRERKREKKDKKKKKKKKKKEGGRKLEDDRTQRLSVIGRDLIKAGSGSAFGSGSGSAFGKSASGSALGEKVAPWDAPARHAGGPSTRGKKGKSYVDPLHNYIDTYEKEHVGKLIKSSKHHVTFALVIGGAHHVLEVKHSQVSGHIQFIFNRKLVKDMKCVSGVNLRLTDVAYDQGVFDEEGHSLSCEVLDKKNHANPFLWNYDVLLDGVSMKKLARDRQAILQYEDRK